MRTDNRRKSKNVDDRRGRGNVGSGFGGGGRRGGRRGGGGGPIIGGGLGLVVLVIFTLMGGNPAALLNNEVINPGSNVEYKETAEEREMADFVSVVLADTEEVWTDVFNDMGYEYSEPTLVLYTDQVKSACGVAGASVGPFYCPGDQQLYIDLTFFGELKTKYGAPGDFAAAYVVAHEVGHHVQTQLGVTEQMNEIRQKVSEKEYNKYSVRFELQADYLAGVWAHHVQGKGYLEEGDLEEALQAASAVGDDRIQKQAQGYVVPDSFTHGTSKQRQDWFYKGYQVGTLDEWDTFNSLD